MHNLLLHHCVKKLASSLASQLLTLTTTFSKENFAPSIMLEKQERGSEHYSFLLLRLTTARRRRESKAFYTARSSENW